MSVSLQSLEPMPLDVGESVRLDRALAGLSASQLQWVSGYAAGLAAVATPAAAPDRPAAPALTVLFGSQTGNGEALARQLAAEAEDRGVATRLASLADYKPAGLRREKFVTFVVSTHGEGDPPDDAELFREFLLSDRAPKLDGLRFSVLALGDSSYVNFCQTGREFDLRLRELGATPVLPLVECDLDYADAAAAWRRDLLGQLPDSVVAEPATPRLRAVEPPPEFDRQRPFAAEVLVNQKITGRGSTKDVRHIELSLEGSGLAYEPGDALGVVASNPPELVLELLSLLALDGGSKVTQKGGDCRLDEALTNELEITAVSAGFLESWLGVSASADLAALIADKAALGELIRTHQVIDVVRRFPADVTPQALVDGLRKLGPRSYSIASSLAANPEEAHLTVAAVRYEAFGSRHWGAASTHLADRVAEGERVRVFVERNKRFRLPEDDARDIVMIGPGTGVAPFRAFVEERAERGARGRNWLFFGDRNFSCDFLYQLEWQRHLKRGNLDRLDVAFSRDQADKVYVQDRIRERGAEVYRWIEGGAHVYVCGEAGRMARDVDDALAGVIARFASVGPDEAADRLKALRRAGRYQRDVY